MSHPSDPGGPRAALVVRYEKWSQCMALDARPLLIGRGEDCDVHVPDGRVSRHHCRIVPTDTGWLVEDLGSQAGTHVAGRPVVAPTPVAAGQEILVGPLVAEIVGAAERGLLSGEPTRDEGNTDRRSEGIALGRLALVRSRQERLDDAPRLAREAVAIHRQIGNLGEEVARLVELVGGG